MNHQLVVKESIEINVPAEYMWKVLTEPHLIKKYLFGTNVVTNWKEGELIQFSGEYEGHKYEDKGIVEKVIPFEKLSYWYWSNFSGLSDLKENYSLVTYEINKISATTCLFTWIQQGFATEAGYEHSKKGMSDFLNSIKEISEQK